MGLFSFSRLGGFRAVVVSAACGVVPIGVIVPITKETVSGGRLPDEGAFGTTRFARDGGCFRLGGLHRPQLSAARRLQQQLSAPDLWDGSGSASCGGRT